MNVDELNMLDDHELVALEDQLLLERELNPYARIRHTGGRFIILVLSIFVWLILKIIFIKLTSSIESSIKGFFSFVLFFISLGLAVVISHYIWKSIGIAGRFWLRNILHYWPMSFYLFFGIVILLNLN